MPDHCLVISNPVTVLWLKFHVVLVLRRLVSPLAVRTESDSLPSPIIQLKTLVGLFDYIFLPTYGASSTR